MGLALEVRERGERGRDVNYDSSYERVKRRLSTMLPLLDERQRRIFVAVEARDMGKGGIAIVSRITGMSRATIAKGLRELNVGVRVLEDGRARITKLKRDITRRYPGVLEDIRGIIENEEQQKENILHYTTKSAKDILAAIKEKGIDISYATMIELLKKDGYTLWKGDYWKRRKNDSVIERQFSLINEKIYEFLTRQEPVLTLEGKTLDPKKFGNHMPIYDFDSLNRELKKPGPAVWCNYFHNQHFLDMRMGREVSNVALQFIDTWFETEFRIRYPGAAQLLIIVDYSEDDGRFRSALAELAEKTNVAITLLHFPPGITKWSDIEHRYSYFSGKEGCIRAAVIAYLIGRKKNTGIDVNYSVEMRGEREESTGWNRSTELFPDDCEGYSYTFMPDRWTGRGTRIGG